MTKRQREERAAEQGRQDAESGTNSAFNHNYERIAYEDAKREEERKKGVVEKPTYNPYY